MSVVSTHKIQQKNKIYFKLYLQAACHKNTSFVFISLLESMKNTNSNTV